MKKVIIILLVIAIVLIIEYVRIDEISELFIKEDNLIEEDQEIVSKSLWETNPLISNILCADPTSIEYNGRLYIYGTNDQQEYDNINSNGENSFKKINSFVIISTDDMINYTYHGTIDVKEICPWTTYSWAPTITSRIEDDGLTHFYLYFTNGGDDIGIITATSPLGPWTDPLGSPIIDRKINKPKFKAYLLDPGVCIDDDGNGWLTFGGLDENGKGARIVKLGKDMTTLDSDIKSISAPDHWEANELNFINGTYVYSYCTKWRLIRR